jgi:hypothetical protein
MFLTVCRTDEMKRLLSEIYPSFQHTNICIFVLNRRRRLCSASSGNSQFAVSYETPNTLQLQLAQPCGRNVKHPFCRQHHSYRFVANHKIRKTWKFASFFFSFGATAPIWALVYLYETLRFTSVY